MASFFIYNIYIMPVQIKMNTNLSNRSLSRSASSLVVPSVVPPSSSLGSSSIGQFQNSMIGRVHLSKPGCSSCGH